MQLAPAIAPTGDSRGLRVKEMLPCRVVREGYCNSWERRQTLGWGHWSRVVVCYIFIGKTLLRFATRQAMACVKMCHPNTVTSLLRLPLLHGPWVRKKI